MVLRVVSAITQQFGHSVMWRSSFARISASSDSSRKSLNSLRNSLQVSKGVVPLAFKVPAELFAQLQPRPQEPALDGRNRKIQRFRRFFRGELIDIAQHKDRTIRRLQALD